MKIKVCRWFVGLMYSRVVDKKVKKLRSSAFGCENTVILLVKNNNLVESRGCNIINNSWLKDYYLKARA